MEGATAYNATGECQSLGRRQKFGAPEEIVVADGAWDHPAAWRARCTSPIYTTLLPMLLQLIMVPSVGSTIDEFE
jgi:hypothetical protein